MQRFLQHLRVGALFAISIVPIIRAEAAAGSTQAIKQACISAQRKTKLHEPADLIECRDQKIFPRKKRKLLDTRIGLLKERIQAFKAKPDKAPALASLNTRIVALKEKRGISSEVEPRHLMTPVKRARYDKKRLADFRKTLAQLKKQLGFEQKELALAYKNMIHEERRALYLKQRYESKYSRDGLRSKIGARQKQIKDLKNKLAKTSKKSSVPYNISSIIKDIQNKLSTTQEGLDSLKKRLAKAPDMSEEVQENLYKLLTSPRKIETLAQNIIKKHGPSQHRKTRRNHNMEIRS